MVSVSLYTKLAEVEDPFSQLDFGFVIFIILYTLAESILILRLGIIKFGGLSLKSIGWRANSWRSDIFYGVLGGVISIGAIYFLGLFFGNWDWLKFVSTQKQFTFSNRILFLLIGLNAGFIEESLFRGFLQPAAVKNFGFAFGLIFTSFVFAAYHLKFNPQVFIGKFVLGLIFGALRGRDRPLLRPALAHALLWAAIGSL